MKPRIFISAVTSGLRTTRQLVANALLRLGYAPVIQEIIGTESGDLRQVLRDKIDDCDELIQLVGRGYGAEPSTVDPEMRRVSYTQFEFLHAEQKKKKTWVIFAEEGCTRDMTVEQLDLPRDTNHPDPAAYRSERRALQVSWRQRLHDEGHLRHEAHTDTELELKIERLKDELAQLHRGFRRWQKLVLGACVAIAVLVGGVLFRQGFLKQDTEEIKNATDNLTNSTTAGFEKTQEQLDQIKQQREITAARIRARLVESSEKARDAELAVAEQEPRYDERERLRALAQQAHDSRLSRIDDLAARFAELEQREDTTAEFREMLRILEDETDNPVE